MKCLEPFIDTYIGYLSTKYECSMKDKSVIGVVLGLNRVKQWEYTSSPLYGPIFFTTPIYIEMPRALHRRFYWVSMYQIYVCDDGCEMDWRHCRPKLLGFVKNTSSPLYGLFFFHKSNIHSDASSPSSTLLLGIHVPNISVQWRIWDGLATLSA